MMTLPVFLLTLNPYICPNHTHIVPTGYTQYLTVPGRPYSTDQTQSHTRSRAVPIVQNIIYIYTSVYPMSPCHFLLNPVLYITFVVHTVHSSTYSHSHWMYYVRDHNITDTVLFTSQCKLRHCTVYFTLTQSQFTNPVSGLYHINPQVQFYRVTRCSFLKLKIPRFPLNSFVPVHR